MLSRTLTITTAVRRFSSKPIASRIIRRSSLEGLRMADTQAYLAHHLELAGGSADLIIDEAVTAGHIRTALTEIIRNRLDNTVSTDLPLTVSVSVESQIAWKLVVRLA